MLRGRVRMLRLIGERNIGTTHLKNCVKSMIEWHTSIELEVINE